MGKYADGKKQIEAELAQIKKHCTTIRVLAHTQVCLGWARRCSSLRGVVGVWVELVVVGCEGGCVQLCSWSWWQLRGVSARIIVFVSVAEANHPSSNPIPCLHASLPPINPTTQQKHTGLNPQTN